MRRVQRGPTCERVGCAMSAGVRCRDQEAHVPMRLVEHLLGLAVVLPAIRCRHEVCGEPRAEQFLLGVFTKLLEHAHALTVVVVGVVVVIVVPAVHGHGGDPGRPDGSRSDARESARAKPERANDPIISCFRFTRQSGDVREGGFVPPSGALGRTRCRTWSARLQPSAARLQPTPCCRLRWPPPHGRHDGIAQDRELEHWTAWPR